MRRIYNINGAAFEGVALEAWRFQYQYNPLYQLYANTLGIQPENVDRLEEIPFLPIQFFKEHAIKTGDWHPEAVFASSGTTGSSVSRHAIRDLSWYRQVADLCFSTHYGSPAGYTWIGLLPSYLERPDSSLVSMVHAFMQAGLQAHASFYRGPDNRLVETLQELSRRNEATVLIGVSFALLDLFEQYPVPVWDRLLVIETGGMKGRREEVTREELHRRIRQYHPGLHLSSEYGMTELLSQAYWHPGGFSCGPTMRVLIRDISDPLSIVGNEQRGGINVVDLANLDTCCFLATDDVGIRHASGSFEVLGRLDQSDMRGCNLMYAGT